MQYADRFRRRLNPQGDGSELEVIRESNVWNGYKLEVDLRNRSKSIEKLFILEGSSMDDIKEYFCAVDKDQLLDSKIG